MVQGKKRERPGSSEVVSFRDVSGLFVHPTTWRCAQRDRCVSCSYKVGCWDVALDSALCRSVPNVRPELCPRSSKADNAKELVLGYDQPGLRVLTVGDGDFSFSLAVARRVALCDPSQMASSVCATSYESLETLRGVYDNMEETMKELHDLRVKVAFQVDATRLDETLFCHREGTSDGPPQFDRIVWNFPCTAVAKGQDGQNQEMEHNKDMVRRFVSKSRHYLAPGGEIHMNHKTKVRMCAMTLG
jgi:25S rRNA (uracil2634-N3)-methyltransferase